MLKNKTAPHELLTHNKTYSLKIQKPLVISSAQMCVHGSSPTLPTFHLTEVGHFHVSCLASVSESLLVTHVVEHHSFFWLARLWLAQFKFVLVFV